MHNAQCRHLKIYTGDKNTHMTLDREWEKFSGGPNKPNRDRIHITINKTGLIYINGNGHRMLGRPEAVQLFFNRPKDKIALKPAHARLSDAFPVKEKSGYYLVHASPFCRHYGIKFGTTEKFVLPDIDDDGILHLDLTRTVTVSGKNPKRRK